MRTYEIKIQIMLDDNGYILQNDNWIYQAIVEQLETGERISKFKIREIIEEDNHA